jgi:hypothetical protein
VLPSQGSPFRTGILNILYPGFKRNAAILGDLVFTLTRRVFLTSAKAKNPSVPAWSYLASYNYGTPILGTFHGADLLQVFYGILPNYASRSIQTYYTNFVYNLDPNKGVGGFMNWPEWGQSRKLMQFWNNRGELINEFHRRNGPLLSGIRCLRREIFEAVPETHLKGFAIETALNWACRELGKCTTTIVLHNLKHLVKEKKRGLWRGLQARNRMFLEVFKAYMDLEWNRPALRHHGMLATVGGQYPERGLEYINF